MFGRSNDKEIAEIKTGSLNLFYVDRITEKRKKSNKISAGEDITVAVLTDASETEFRKLFDDFIAEIDLNLHLTLLRMDFTVSFSINN